MSPRAIICGGSIGGLFCASLLRRAGWTTLVLERSRTELAGRGAGIVTHDLLINLIAKTGASITDLGVQVQDRVAFDIAGDRVATMPIPQIVTSWDRVHSLLRALVPNGSYLLNKAVDRYDDHGDSVSLTCEDGSQFDADIVIGADGFRSALRAQMQPAVQPVYSGYVVWRCLAHESDLPPDLRDRIFDSFGFFLPQGTQILGYPIAGPGNDLRPGHRRYNFVWYAPVDATELADMLTDPSGTQHAVTIPPPLVRDEVLARMHAFARAHLARPFLDLLASSERPFFTPIYDHLAPHFADGRVALVGDAACVARPHVGMGVTKAAADAEALARHLSEAPALDALQAYARERQAAAALAHATAQRLGSYIFAAPAKGSNHDGRNNPNLARILAETAVVPAASDHPVT
ncbi:MAG: FAD-dependent oxidoreductase [Alphaproteobacteria bacterium]|nr:FAD-dependent oxidoreductase [Alphaproteobacteria bacterium]